MTAVGIFGGTFDPIHLGHLITAQSVKEIRGLDKIIFIPAYISPHKQEVKSLSASLRLEMVRLAIKNVPYFECSDSEIVKQGVSYTVDTLRELKLKYERIELIIGYDNIIDFKTWREPDKILELASLIVLKRQSSVEPDEKDKYYKSAFFVETPCVEISSSRIRERIARNLPINFLVPEKVNEFIMNNNLYKEQQH